MSLKIIFCVTLLAIFSMALPFSAQALETKVAVVDVEKILNVSKAGKSLETKLKQRRETFQKEFSQREDDLMNAEKVLVQQKADLSPEDFAKKRKEFEAKLLETRNLFQKRRGALDKGLGNSLSKLRSSIIEVTAEIADQKGYNIVLTRDSVVIVQKEMDITDQVLTSLNQKVPNLPLDVTN